MDESTRQKLLEGNLRVPAHEVTGEEWMEFFSEIFHKWGGAENALKDAQGFKPLLDFSEANSRPDASGWRRLTENRVLFWGGSEDPMNHPVFNGRTHFLRLCRIYDNLSQESAQIRNFPEEGFVTEIHLLLTRKAEWIKWQANYERVFQGNDRIERARDSRLALIDRDGMIRILDGHRHHHAFGADILYALDDAYCASIRRHELALDCLRSVRSQIAKRRNLIG